MEQNYDQQGGYQDMYQQYPYQQNQYEQKDKSVMSVGDWLVTLLALLIPCAGIILYFVWAFGKTENENRKNYCRAYLIYWAITSVLSIIFLVVFSATIFKQLAGVQNFYY